MVKIERGQQLHVRSIRPKKLIICFLGTVFQKLKQEVAFYFLMLLLIKIMYPSNF